MNKRSLQIGSRKTGITVEDAFWDGLKQISTETSTSVKDLITGVDGAETTPISRLPYASSCSNFTALGKDRIAPHLAKQLCKDAQIPENFK